jgi:hypothetical protein
MKLKSLPGVKLSLVAMTIILFWVFTNIRVGPGGWWRDSIHNDAKGYYAYLPAVFIYNDLNFNFFTYADSALQLNKSPCDYRLIQHDKHVNKYYAGVAVAQMPFFFASHAYALADPDARADGYSYPYIYGICLAAIFYSILGLYLLNKILLLYNISVANRIITLWVTLFGTNLFQYTVGEPGMSHAYSFAFVALFVYHVLLWLKTNRFKNLVVASLALGIIMLIRPVNIMVVLFLPFLAGSAKAFGVVAKQWISSYKNVVVAIAVPLSVFSIQLIIYKIACGHFFVYSYGGETFDFLHAKIFAILFSYKKGLFVYTPVLLIAMFGLILFLRQSLFKGISFFLAFLGVTYVLSSWWSWWYGGSFSGRIYIEYFPFLMIGFATVLNAIKNKIARGVTISVLVVLVAVCQLQTWQYRHGYIHWDSMTKEMYWDAFLKTR